MMYDVFSVYFETIYIFMGLRDTTKSQNRGELFQGKTDKVTMEISLKKLSLKIVTILNKL